MTGARTDVLIVGGGVIGLACAHFLLDAGRSVRIVDMDAVGSGCSAGNCGLITPSHAAPLTAPGRVGMALRSLGNRRAPLYIKPTLRVATLRWLWQFALRCNARDMRQAAVARAALLNSSRRLYDTLVAEHHLQCDWSAQGVLAVYRDAKSMRAAESADSALQGLGVRATSMTSDELWELEPALHSGLCARLYETDAQLRPELLVAAMARLVRRRGGLIEEACRVRGFERGRGGVEGVRTQDSTYCAETLVLAAGAWTPELVRQIGVRLPIEPGKGYSITMECGDGERPRFACILVERSIGVTPWRGGYRLGGTMEFAGFDATLTRTRLAAILDGARLYLREAPAAIDTLEVWCGLRPMTPDEIPFVCRVPAHPNVVIAAGHGMMGVSMAPATGKLVAELISGTVPHVDPTPYRIERG